MVGMESVASGVIARHPGRQLGDYLGQQWSDAEPLRDPGPGRAAGTGD